MNIKLVAQTREIKEKLSSDFIPGVLYGKERENQNLKIKKVDFDKAFKSAGESNLIDLDYGSGPFKVLIKATQRDIVKGFFIHVDFYQVNMKEKISTEIPLVFIGESLAVKELGGSLTKDLDSLEVECLPGDLVDHIDVDISVLKTFDDAIRVNDLNLPKELNLVRDTNELVVAVREPKTELESEEEATEEKSENGSESKGDTKATDKEKTSEANENKGDSKNKPEDAKKN